MDLYETVEEIIIDDDNVIESGLLRLPDPIVIKPEVKSEHDAESLEQALALLYSQPDGIFLHEKDYSCDFDLLQIEETCKDNDWLDSTEVKLESHVSDHVYAFKTECPTVDEQFYDTMNGILKNLNTPSIGVSNVIFMDDKTWDLHNPRNVTNRVVPQTLQLQAMPLPNRALTIKYKSISNNMQRIKIDFPCGVCDRTFSTKFSAFRHELIHTTKDREQFQCEFCDRLFAQDSSLYRHIQLIHVGDKPHQCSYCDKTFGLRQTLRAHIRTHTGERPFQCELCDKRFIGQGHLKNHLLTHSSHRAWECEFCDKAFKRKDKLMIHYKTHESDKQYRCRQCSKSYTAKQDLEEHRDEFHRSPVNCDVCNKTYCTKYYLSKHKCWGVEESDDDEDVDFSIVTRSSARKRRKVCKPGCSCCENE